MNQLYSWFWKCLKGCREPDHQPFRSSFIRYNVVDIKPVLTCRAAEWPQHMTAEDCVTSTCFKLAFINNHTIKHRHQTDPSVGDPVGSSSSSGSTLSSLNTRLNQSQGNISWLASLDDCKPQWHKKNNLIPVSQFMEDVIQISVSEHGEEQRHNEAHDLLSDLCQKHKALEYIVWSEDWWTWRTVYIGKG